MNISKLLLAVVLLTLSRSVLAEQNLEALAEFENQIASQRSFFESLEKGEIYLPFKIQQYDTAAKEIKPYADIQAYKAAVTDRFYGYQVFILVDKSLSSRSSRQRLGDVREPQTIYVYVREGDQLRLKSTYAVSTGKEPKKGSSDTREGFFRVQNAQAEYVSRKFGSSMPYSLWIESEYGIAIHETLPSRCNSMIGKRASAGCVRLCPGDAEEIFRLVTDEKYPRSSAIVLLDKQTGVPVGRGTSRPMAATKDLHGSYLNLPKVIQGYPAFVRVIDGTNQEKIQEIESIINEPTAGFQKYFTPISQDVLQQLTI